MSAMYVRDPETGKFIPVGGGGGSAIDDTTPSTVTVYSSKKTQDEIDRLDEQINEQKEAIDAKGDPTDEQVSTAVKDFLTENPVSGGMTTTQINLLKTLGNYLVFSDAATGQTIFDNLVKELERGATGGDTGGGDEPDIPDTPDVPDTPTSYTITNSLTNVSTDNSATSVDANAAYTATLTPDSGYSISTVTVTMGGVNVTDTVYANGVITIEAVTGDVVIMATGAASDNLITAEVLAQAGEGRFPDGTNADGIDTLITPMIAVEPNGTYYTNIGKNLPDGTTKWNQKYAYYDAEKNYIGAKQISGNNSPVYSLTLPENAHYVAFFFYAVLTNPYFGKSGVIV